MRKAVWPVSPSATAKDLNEFMEAIAKRYPQGNVFVIWDNLNIHRGTAWEAFNARHGGRFHFVFTPKHASWINQIELWFSILQRRVIRFGQFRSREELAARIEEFIQHWNRHESHPFRWTFRGRFRQHPELRAA
jgi:transposase